jgi:prolyl-tRNA synthetase
MVGGLIMTHGDDAGLRVPPALAPVQVVVLVVRDEDGAGEKAAALAEQIRAAGVRVDLDNREGQFGRRAVDWEIKGVPVRLEIGPRDIAEGKAVMVRRDKDEKAPTPLDGLPTRIPEVLDEMQTNLRDEAKQRQEDRTVDAGSVEEAIEAAKTGFARVAWDNSGELEDRLNQESISVRCLRRRDGIVPLAPDEDDLVAVVARAY